MDTSQAQPRAAISWSAGKDACLALLQARAQGWLVQQFFTLCEPDGLSKSHALQPALIQAQVQALGGTWQPVLVAPGAYGPAFAATLDGLKASGISAVIFGDIDLQAHRDWLAPACARAGLQALFPLWGQQRAALAQQVIASGMQARLVCVDTRWLDATFCGAAYDQALLDRLPAGVCPVGEGGEFHTVVLGGPGFAAALQVLDLPQRRVASTPPLSPTTLVFQPMVLRPALPAGA